MNVGIVSAATAVRKMAFVVPCNGSATIEGVPRDTGLFRFRRVNENPPSRFSNASTVVESGKRKPEEEQRKNVEQKPDAGKKDEGTDFANQCIVDMYATTVFKRSGAYSLG